MILRRNICVCTNPVAEGSGSFESRFVDKDSQLLKVEVERYFCRLVKVLGASKTMKRHAFHPNKPDF